jgi:hypothetical protein
LLYFGSHNQRGNRFEALAISAISVCELLFLSMRPFAPLHQSRFEILNNRSLWISVGAAMVTAALLAGCGTLSYPDGRSLPPSGLLNRVMIAIQNPGTLNKGALELVDGYYDERTGYNGKPPLFAISGYSGALPYTIQNMPEEQIGAVYGEGDGSLIVASYSKERVASLVSGIPAPSASIFITRNQSFVFAANPASHQFTIGIPSAGGSIGLNLPDVYRVSVNPAGSVVLAFVQNSPYVYYPHQLSAAQGVAYSGGPSTWPKAAVDCEPQNSPAWCLFQMQSPDNHYVDAAGITEYYGAPLVFDHPIKAVFSSDGGTAYILSCGPECGGTTAGFTPVTVAPMIFFQNQASGLLPTTAALAQATVPVPGGASNALIDSSTLYIVGQAPKAVNGLTLFTGNLTVVSLPNDSITNTAAISDGTPGATSRMIEADDNTLWIAMTGCDTGVRYATNPESGYGCLTMYNTATNAVVLIEPYLGDGTGIAAITGLHKIYTAEGGQVYIYSTVDGSSIDNEYVAVTGTASDVAYMDALTDANNTVY